MKNNVIELDLKEIMPNRFQPRIKFNEESLKELTMSIKEHGVIQPIVVRTLGDKYEIIAGERRFKASEEAGKTTIPAIVMDISDKEVALVALLENVQRKDLTPIEEAISYKKILDMGGINQTELAAKIGKNQSTVANKLRLLNLSDEVQEALLDEKISERHARSLLKLSKESDQDKMLNRIINERLTVRAADEEIKKMLAEKENEPEKKTTADGLTPTKKEPPKKEYLFGPPPSKQPSPENDLNKNDVQEENAVISEIGIKENNISNLFPTDTTKAQTPIINENTNINVGDVKEQKNEPELVSDSLINENNQKENEINTSETNQDKQTNKLFDEFNDIISNKINAHDTQGGNSMNNNFEMPQNPIYSANGTQAQPPLNANINNNFNNDNQINVSSMNEINSNPEVNTGVPPFLNQNSPSNFSNDNTSSAPSAPTEDLSDKKKIDKFFSMFKNVVSADGSAATNNTNSTSDVSQMPNNLVENQVPETSTVNPNILNVNNNDVPTSPQNDGVSDAQKINRFFSMFENVSSVDGKLDAENEKLNSTIPGTYPTIPQSNVENNFDDIDLDFSSSQLSNSNVNQSPEINNNSVINLVQPLSNLSTNTANMSINDKFVTVPNVNNNIQDVSSNQAVQSFPEFLDLQNLNSNNTPIDQNVQSSVTEINLPNNEPIAPQPTPEFVQPIVPEIPSVNQNQQSVSEMPSVSQVQPVAPEMPPINPVPPVATEVSSLEQIQQINIAPPTIESSPNTENDSLNKLATGDLKSTINTLRECIATIESYGFVVDSEEIDLPDKYQVIINIIKK